MSTRDWTVSRAHASSPGSFESTLKGKITIIGYHGEDGGRLNSMTQRCQVKKANGAKWLAFWLSLSLPIVLNHHPMTSLFVFLILPSFDNKPSHLNRRRRREKNGNLIIRFNQEDESRTKE
jgi:hypothetical protein